MIIHLKKMKLIKILHNLKKGFNFLLVLSAIVFSLYFFWRRYIRERLPQEIPFELSTLGFIFLSFICITYLSAILFIVLKHKTNTTNSFMFIKEFVFKPLELFISFVQYNKITEIIFEKYFLLLLKTVKTLDYFKVYLILELLPRLILVNIFFVDVFYFHNINYFYNFIFIRIIVMFGNNILYIYNYILKTNIDFLVERVEIYIYNRVNPEEPSIEEMSIKILIHLQMIRVLKGLEQMFYVPALKIAFMEKEEKRLGISNYTYNIEKFKTEMRGVINLSISIFKIIYLYEKEQNKYKYIIVICNILYLICWSYILFTGNYFLSDGFVSII